MCTPSPALPSIAVRGSEGVWLYDGPPKNSENLSLPRDSSKFCKVFTFSNDGKLFAWCNGQSVSVVSLPSCIKIVEMYLSKTTNLIFSPKGTYMATWEPFSGGGGEGRPETPNLNIFRMRTGECVMSWVHKKQNHWYPEWSEDETLCARLVGSEIIFYEHNNFGSDNKKFNHQKVSEFSLAGGRPPHHFGCYVPGTKGQPSFVRVYQYPNFQGLQCAIANKSFFKGDKVDFLWNKIGTGLLLLTGQDVDKSGSSYYGVQNLHYVGTNGDSCIVDMGVVSKEKNATIHFVQWSPTSTEFCVVYGSMPAKASLFNTKCEVIFDYGTGHRNQCHFSPRGNLLVLAGFGNLRGHVEVWETKTHKKVSSFQAEDSTYFQWCPDNEHILTATTSPRLRVGNELKIWDYSGTLHHRSPYPEGQELWEVTWQPAGAFSFPERPIRFTAELDEVKSGAANSAPVAASKEVYRPPGLRGKPSGFKLHEFEPAKAPRNPYQVVGLPEAAAAPQNANKKKAAANKPAERGRQNQPQGENKTQDKDKQVKNITKKLAQIEKLKVDLAEGKQLDNDQHEKIKRESQLRKQLEELKL